MQAFERLGSRGQVGRLRRLAEAALVRYGIAATRVVLLAHRENTTFRVETGDGARYLLRIHRTTGSPFQPPRSVAEVRICALFRWGQGRFADAGLRPSHLERVGGFIARSHAHASGFSPPAGFTRWRRYDVSGQAGAYVVRVIGEHCDLGTVGLVETVTDLVLRTERDLGEGPEGFELIHGDLHPENVLFERGRVRAIDFDDCGWGHYLYDLAVPLSELRWRPDYDARHAGLLRGYRAVRPLPVDDERHLEVFHGLRLLQLVLWLPDHRAHPGFTAWEDEVRTLLADLAAHTRVLGQHLVERERSAWCV